GGRPSGIGHFASQGVPLTLQTHAEPGWPMDEGITPLPAYLPDLLGLQSSEPDPTLSELRNDLSTLPSTAASQASHARDLATPFESAKPIAATLMDLHCFATASELFIAKPAANNAMMIGTPFIMITRSK
ncbi:MAG TPA: hypothetical protein VH858_16565, partial [Hyphomicrobiales bacterium]